MESIRKGLCLYQAESSSWPLIDLYETGSELVFEIDLPGIEPEALSIRVYGDMLMIEGIIKNSHSEADLHYICMERGIRRFRRVMQIPVPVNASDGEARYARGVITIKFPKCESKTILIPVKRAAE